ncbi:RNA-binding protein [Bradyrhizobium sp. 164]|nr:RNA-binding protein [Bradyrhizobium sp. 164]
MPRGPKGEKRPGDVIGAAIMVGKIATGEIEEGSAPESKAAAALGRRGGKARAAALTPEQRAEIARAAADARWKKG